MSAQFAGFSCVHLSECVLRGCWISHSCSCSPLGVFSRFQPGLSTSQAWLGVSGSIVGAGTQELRIVSGWTAAKRLIPCGIGISRSAEMGETLQVICRVKAWPGIGLLRRSSFSSVIWKNGKGTSRSSWRDWFAVAGNGGVAAANRRLLRGLAARGWMLSTGCAPLHPRQHDYVARSGLCAFTMGFAWGSGCSSPRVSRPRWRAGSVRMVARDPRTPFALLTAPRGYRWRNALRAWALSGARCGPIRAREPPRLQPVFAVRTGVGTGRLAASGAAVLPGCGWWDSPRRASLDGRFAMRSAWALGQSPVAGCGCAGRPPRLPRKRVVPTSSAETGSLPRLTFRALCFHDGLRVG